MSSLRARLLAAVLAITAVGLLALAAITYSEQRNFQLRPRRPDRPPRARARSPARSPSTGIGPARHPRPRRRPRRRPAARRRPRRRPAGRHLRGAAATNGGADPILFDYGQNISASPKIPAEVDVGKPKTVSGSGDDGRATASSPPRSAAATSPSSPSRSTEVDQTLHRLAARRGARDRRRAARARRRSRWVVVRIGLLPLDRMGHTAGRIAGGDLSHRVEADRPAHRGRPRSGSRSTAMLDRLEGAFAERRRSEERLRRFLADASHELRTPLASIRGYAELYRMGAARADEDVEKAMRRIEDEAARMGVLVEDLLTLARLDEVARRAARAGRPRPARARRRRRRARDRARPPDRASTPTAPRSCSATPTSCARCSATCPQRARPHARRHARSRSASAARTARCGSRSATTAPASRPTTRTRCSSASGAPRAGASAARPAPGSGWRSSPASSAPTAAA